MKVTYSFADPAFFEAYAPLPLFDPDDKIWATGYRLYCMLKLGMLR